MAGTEKHFLLPFISMPYNDPDRLEREVRDRSWDIAATEEVMMTIEPGKVAHGGTYSGSLIAAAAAVTTLDILENEPITETINKRGKLLMSGIGEILADASIPHVLVGVPSMLGNKIGMNLIPRGVFPEVSHEPWFLCYSLSEQDVADTLTALEESVKEATV